VVAGEGRSRDVARAWSVLERNLLTVSNAYRIAAAAFANLALAGTGALGRLAVG